MTNLDFNAMPSELKDTKAWLVWRYEIRDGKKTKPPYQPNGRPADSTDPETWSTFDDAKDAYFKGGWDGIGVCLEGSGYVGIDLDHIKDGIGGIKQSVIEVVEKLNSYTEMTPSGDGLHIWIRGSKPEGSRCKVSNFDGKGTDIEIYDSGRYFTMTGEHGKETSIHERQQELEDVLKQITPTKVVPIKQPDIKLSLSDREILEKCRRAKNGSLFTALYDYGHQSGDASGDDLSLLNIMAFYCEDVHQLDRLFRSSACMRDKWDEQRPNGTYGEITLAKAMDGRTAVYSGPQNGAAAFSVEDLASDPVVVSTEGSTPAEPEPIAEPKTLDELLPIIKRKAFWHPTKKVFGLLSDRHGLIYFSRGELQAQFNLECDVNFAKEHWAPVGDLLVRENQRDRIAKRVDYFATDPSIVIAKDDVRILLPWEPFKVPSRDGIENYDAIIADYREHFKEFDRFVELLAAMAFGSNLKKAYLWIQALSDWGKGFLMNVLEGMGIATVMEQGEVDKALSGSPVGLEADAFLRILAVVFDEFSSVNANVKRLDGEIHINEKFKPRATVQLPLKLYLSKDDVPSMVGAGVESQFANRFSYLSYGDSVSTMPINCREVFVREGQDAYFRAVSHYVGSTVNALIEEYIALGKNEAAKRADQTVNSWHATHAIVDVFGGREDYLLEFCDMLVKECQFDTPWKKQYVREHEGKTYILKMAQAVTDLAVSKFGDKGKAQAYSYSEVTRILQAGPDKPGRHRVPEQVRAVEVHPNWRNQYVAKHGLDEAANDEGVSNEQEIA